MVPLPFTIDPRLHRIVAAQPYRLLFATISGAHLYGFPPPDSDFDLRGAHVLPLEKVVGLEIRDETVEDSRVIEGLEMDIVSHDVRKFFGLLLKKNGYVLEQLFSPHIVHTTPEHGELKAIASGGGGTSVITKHHSHHYFGSCRDAVEVVRQRTHAPRETAALRLSRAADRHPPNAHGQSRGEPRHVERRIPTALHRRPRGAQTCRSGEIETGGRRHRLPRIRIPAAAW